MNKNELANEILEAMVQATQELVVANQEMSVINLDDVDELDDDTVIYYSESSREYAESIGAIPADEDDLDNFNVIENQGE